MLIFGYSLGKGTSSAGYRGSIFQTQDGVCSILEGESQCTAQSIFTVVTRNPIGAETFTWSSLTVGVNIVSGQGTKTITTETTGSVNTPFTIEVECNDTDTTINKSRDAVDTRLEPDASLLLLANGSNFFLLSDGISNLIIKG